MATLTVQPPGDATAQKDTWIYAGTADTNYGTNGDVEVGYNGTGILHGLIQFDLSALPSGAEISSAVLTIKTTGTAPVAFTMKIHRILAANSAWTKAGATWNHQVGTTDWTGSVGCSTSNTDYSSTEMASQSITTDTNTVYNIDLSVAEVSTMAATNRGMILKSSDEGTTGYALFYSSDDATEGNRPKIVITYTLGQAGYILISS